MGLFQGIEFIGTIIGSGMSGYVIENLGFKGGFILSSILAVAATVLLVVPPHVRRETHQHTARASMKLGDLPEVLVNPTLVIMAVVTLAEFVMSTGLIYTVFPLYAEETLGFPLAEIGYIMGARSVGFVVAMFTMGSISDRVGRKPVLTFGIVSTAVLIMAMNYVTGYFALAALICVVGFTSGAIWIMGPVLAAEAVKPHQRGAGIGVYRTFFDLGSVFGPIIMTAFLVTYGVAYCFYLSAGLLLISAPLALMIKESRSH
jgi:MFS family permease